MGRKVGERGMDRKVAKRDTGRNEAKTGTAWKEVKSLSDKVIQAGNRLKGIRTESG